MESKESLEQVENDSLLVGLYKASKHFGCDLKYWQIAGSTGIGARFTLSMNTRNNNEIGHPSSEYIWDIITTMTRCFSLFDWKLYIGEGYLGARDTAAQENRHISDNVYIIDKEITMEGPTISATPSGTWKYSQKSLTIKDDNAFPFGPVVIKITGVNSFKNDFPVNLMKYLLDTLERGEEPMEISGRGHYSAVSGWKAYARWMQSHSIPLRNIIHPYQKKLLNQLYERRMLFVTYLGYLAENLVIAEEKELIQALYIRYKNIIPYIDNLLKEGMNFRSIKEVYFIEQKTLPTYKKIRNYLSN